MLAAPSALRLLSTAAATTGPDEAPGWMMLRNIELAPEADREEMLAAFETAFTPLVHETDGLQEVAVLQPHPLVWTALCVWRDRAAADAAADAIDDSWKTVAGDNITGAASGWDAPVDLWATAADSAGDSGWSAIRSYRLKPDADRAALVALTDEEFLPIVQALDGFSSFAIVRPEPDLWVAVTMWRDQPASESSIATIRQWVKANVMDSVIGSPDSAEGPVDLAILPDATDMQATPDA
ncbi:MAG: hypothetical protein ACR2J8_14445, partial [Thermomicrobiales bacterium]